MTPRTKVPWSKGDKLMMLALGVGLPLVLGLALWFHVLDQNPSVTIPTPAMPAPNARDYYLTTSNAMVDGTKIGYAVTPPSPAAPPSPDQHTYSLADKAKLVAENVGAIRTLHTGFHYLYQEPPIRSFSTALPQFGKMRGAVWLLALQAQVDAGKGDMGGAINADLDAVQMGETMPRGGPIIGMLVGDDCQAVGRKQAWEVTEHLNSAQARAAVRRLEAIRASHVPFVDTLQEQEWVGQAGLLELMRSRDWPGNVLMAASEDHQPASRMNWWAKVTQIRLTGKRTPMANYTRYMDQEIAKARRPYAAHLAPPPVPSDQVSQILLSPFDGYTLDGTRIIETKTDTQNALLLATLALRAYRLDHGAYPPTLAALAPGYLKAVPDDPFALSGPLRYKLLGASYVLYSVGPDGKDDGGSPIFDRTQPALAGNSDRPRFVGPESKGDIVAGVNIR